MEKENYRLKRYFIFLLVFSSYISKWQERMLPGADESTPSRSHYFSWINNTNEGWQLTDGPIEVIRPEFDWEGVNYPIQAGKTGSGTGLHQLRDPGYFQDIDGKEYLLYTGSGEEAIGIAFLSLRRPDSNNN